MVRYIVWRCGGNHDKLTPGYENCPEDRPEEWLKTKGFKYSIDAEIRNLNLYRLDAIIDWAETNLSEDFTKVGGHFLLKNEEDRFKFTLRWVE